MRIPALLVSFLFTLLLPLLPVTGHALGNTVADRYAAYEPQGACRSTAQPGTLELASWLVRSYPATGSSGTVRSCTSGGLSEHKDGRAFDWAADVRDAAEKRSAYAFLARAFATDSRGVRHALARQMGIMYVIYDDKIYSSYNGFRSTDYVHANCRDLSSLAKCSRTLRHLDHVHISLSLAGGAAQTSWYRARNTPSLPVLFPRSSALDSERTAVTSIEVPSTGATYSTPFSLRAGVTYRIVATGLARTGYGSSIADPNCTWSRGAFRPSPRTSSGAPTSSTTALLIAGRARWENPTRCSSSHTYQATYTPTRTGRISLRARDADGRSNPGQHFTVHFAREDITAMSLRTRFRSTAYSQPVRATRSGPRASSLLRETVTLNTRSRWGTRTKRALVARARYRVTVTGSATDAGTQFDASCYRDRGTLRSRHTVDPRRPSADHFGVYIAGVQLELRASHNRRLTCTSRNDHRYTTTFTAPVSGVASVRTWDPFSLGDNRGSFTVSLTRLR